MSSTTRSQWSSVRSQRAARDQLVCAPTRAPTPHVEAAGLTYTPPSRLSPRTELEFLRHALKKEQVLAAFATPGFQTLPVDSVEIDELELLEEILEEKMLNEAQVRDHIPRGTLPFAIPHPPLFSPPHLPRMTCWNASSL